MKKLLLLLIPAISWGAPCTGANGYTYCQTLVVDHTKVAANLSNYPAGICFGSVSMGPNCLVNSKQLATAANGGFLQDATHGYDFIITSDSGAMTPLSYEADIHNLTTGETEIWVKLPSVSSTVDLTIYLFYGNASVTTDQSNATAVWDANFIGVHHLQLQSGNTYDVPRPATNSTGGIDLPVGNISGSRFPVPAIAGVVGGGADLAGNGAAFMNDTGPFTAFPPTGSPAPFTMEAWVNLNGTITDGPAFCIGANSTDGDRWSIYWFNAGPSWIIEGRNIGVSFPGATSGWHRIVSVLPAGQTNMANGKVYVDGVSQTLTGTGGVINPIYAGTNPYSSGFICGGVSALTKYRGYVDEMRLSTIERSSDWVLTDYNNQSNVKAFWSNSTTGTSAAAGRTIIIN